MKKHLLGVFVSLMLYQTFCSSMGKALAENAVPDTLSWSWEVSSTASTRTKTCTIEFKDDLLINWGDGVTEWIPDSMSSKTITHVYTVQSNFVCTAVGVGLSYFKADSRRLLSLDVAKSPGLTYLSCSSNQLVGLNLTKNPLLVSLYCGGNDLKSLDLSKNHLLQTLTCSDNQLKSLDCSMVPTLKKITCHTNPLVSVKVHPAGALNYLSCSGCNLTAESLDSIFLELPRLATVSTSKNLYVLSNPGSSACRSDLAAAKNWTLDRVIMQSSFYVPSVSCKASDSIRVGIFLKNTAPAIAFEVDVLIPDGFTLDPVRSMLSAARKGQHVLTIARTSGSSQLYKLLAYSMRNKDVFSGSDGSVVELYLKAPSEMKSYTLHIRKAVLLDTLTNALDLSVTDGQMIVGASSLMGDANGDEKVDVTDIVNLVAWINGQSVAGMDTAAVDIDGNGLWNVLDVAKLVVVVNSYVSALQPSLSSFLPLTEDAMTIYRSVSPLSGNNLYLRQAIDDARCLEICLDNADRVQALQADLFLPDGVTFQDGEIDLSSERISGQSVTLTRLSENHYRLLSYSMNPNVPFAGNSGVLSRLRMDGLGSLSGGKYPIGMRQAVLTGMNLQSIPSKVYDAFFLTNPPLESGDEPTFGTDKASHLWVRGKAISNVTVWDVAGKLVAKEKVGGASYFSIQMERGFYLVKAELEEQPAFYRKVAVK